MHFPTLIAVGVLEFVFLCMLVAPWLPGITSDTRRRLESFRVGGLMHGDLLNVARKFPEGRLDAYGVCWSYWGLAFIKMTPSYKSPAHTPMALDGLRDRVRVLEKRLRARRQAAGGKRTR